MFSPKNIEKLTQLAILKKVDDLKNHIDSLRPFSTDVEGRVLQKLRFDWNYHSNAIEGNSLNYGETRIFLMEGLTAKGKPLKDHLDIRGHNSVVNFLLDIVKEKREISEVDIRALHQEMLVENYYVPAITPDGKSTRKLIKIGEYKTEPNHVEMLNGELHYYASPEEVPARMYELINWYKEAKLNTEIHPIVVAAIFHHEFVAIHPFSDGNGRMSRWLMNLVLLQNHYPITVLKQERRNQYYAALQKADIGDFTDFVVFVAEAVLHSLQIYQKAINGENINEADDLDKEIALFNKELQGREDKIEVKRSIESQKALYENSLKPLVENLELTIRKFKGLFMNNETYSFSNIVDGYFFHFYPFYGYFDSSKTEYRKYKHGEEEFDNLLARAMAYSDNNSIERISFQLIDFKTISNHFSISLIVYFVLDDFYCNLYYDVVDSILLDNVNYLIDVNSKKFLCQKLYHQQLSNIEIQEFCTQIGQEILKVIKEKSQK